MRCVVVGGGISGLVLAHALVKKGLDAILLEEEARVGGKIHTEKTSGYLVERGPASFTDREPALRALIADVGLADRALPAEPAAKRRCVVIDGVLREVPTSPRGLMTSPILPLGAKLRALADLVLPRGPVGEGADESVASFARRHFGKRAATRLFYPLVSGLYAGDPEALSLPSAFEPIAALEKRHRSVIVGAALKLASHRPPRLLSFPDGLDELPKAIAAKLGKRVKTRVGLSRLEYRRGQYRLSVVDHGKAREITAAAVVLAMPAHATAPIVSTMIPRVAESIAAIPYAPVTLVYARFPSAALRSGPLSSYGFLVSPAGDQPDPTAPHLLGAVFASAIFPGRAPIGSELVATRVGGMRQADVAFLPDEDLSALVERELTPLLGLSRRPTFPRLVRHEHALPQYTLGHRWRVAAVDAAEIANPGLFLHGNAYRGLGVPDCVRNSEIVADRVLAFMKK